MNQTKRNWLAALFATLAAVLLAAALCFALPFSNRRASGATVTVSDAAELQNQMAAAQEGDTIQLSADITIPSSALGGKSLGLYASAGHKSQTLDLNGHTLSIETGNSDACFIVSGLTFTVVNSVPDQGGLAGKSHGSFVKGYEDANLILRDIEIAFENNSGSASTAPVVAGFENRLTLDNVTYQLTNASQPYVANIAGRNYTGLAAAVGAASDGQTVQLVASFEEAVTIPAGKNIELDLNGNTLTSKESGTATVTNYGRLTIQDTAEEKGGITRGTQSYYTILNEGVMALDGIHVYNENAVSESAQASLIDNNVDCAAEDAAQLSIRGGTYETKGLNVVKNDNYGVLVIENGAFTNKYVGEDNSGGASVILAAGASTTISGGTFKQMGANNNYVVRINVAGEYTNSVTISGGEFIGTAEDAPYTYPALYLMNVSGSAGMVSVSISGGVFKGSISERGAVTGEGASAEDALTVTGGLFEGNISLGSTMQVALQGGDYAMIPPNQYLGGETELYQYTSGAAEKEGLYVLASEQPANTEKAGYIKVGSGSSAVTYNSLADALVSTVSNNIYLLNDIAESVIYTGTANKTIRLQGYTWTAAEGSPAIITQEGAGQVSIYGGTDGTVTRTDAGPVIVNHGKFQLASSGTYSIKNEAAGNYALIENDGMLTIANGTLVSDVVLKNSGTVNITSTSKAIFQGAKDIVNDGGNISIANGTFNGTSANIQNIVGTVTLRGGTYSQKLPIGNGVAIAEGYRLEGENAPYTVKLILAQISRGEEIISFTGTDIWKLESEDTIQNGDTVTILEYVSKTLASDGESFNIKIDASEIVDLVLNASFTGTLTNDGTMNISGGSSGELTVINRGTLNISGGAYSGAVTNSGSLNISGGTFEDAIVNDGGEIKITGGQFAGGGAHAGQGGAYIRTTYAYLADGYYFTAHNNSSSNLFTVGKGKAVATVSHDGVTMDFGSFEAAAGYAKYAAANASDLQAYTAVTITLLQDTVLSSGVDLGYNSTSRAASWLIDLNGKTVTSSSLSLFTVGTNSKYPTDVTIKDGELVVMSVATEFLKRAINVNYGTLTLEDVNISYGADTTPPDHMIYVSHAVDGETAELTIDGGKHYGTISAVSGASVEIKRGEFSAPVSADYLASGTSLYRTQENTYVAATAQPAGSEPVALAGAGSSLQDLLNAGGTVVLTENITASVTINADVTVTLDLNGNTLTNEAGYHTITNNGTLTIIDSAGGGVVDNISHACSAVCNNVGGTVVFSGGTFNGGICAVYANTGTDIEISDGTFNSRVYALSGAKIAITGGTFNHSVYSASCENFISGGTFTKEFPAAEYVAENCSLTQYGVVTDIAPAAEIEKDGKVYAFATIADALALASRGDTITLVGNVTENVVIAKNKVVTLDLNGYTLTNATGERGDHTILNNGTLTIIDGSYAGTGRVITTGGQNCAAVYNAIGGEVTLDGGTYTSNRTTGDYYIIQNHSAMTINDGVTVLQPSVVSSGIASGWYTPAEESQTTYLTINGGTFASNRITVKNDEINVLVINGGTFDQTEGYGDAGYAVQSVQNWAIGILGGGTFGANVQSWAYQSGAGIVRGSLDITGGVYLGTVSAHYYINNNESKEDDTPDVEISGGAFASQPAEKFLTAGFTTVSNSEGMFTVVGENSAEADALRTAQVNAQADVGQYLATLGLKDFDLASDDPYTGIQDDEVSLADETAAVNAALTALRTAYAYIAAARSEYDVAGARLAAMEAADALADALAAELSAYKAAVTASIEEAKEEGMADLETWLNAYLDELLGTAGETTGVIRAAAYTAETTDGDIYAKLAQAFSEENAKLVLKYYNDALAAIDAAESVSDVTTAVSAFKAQVASVEAAAGNTPSLTAVYILLAVVLVVAIAVFAAVLLRRAPAPQPAAPAEGTPAAPAQETAVTEAAPEEEVSVSEGTPEDEASEEAPAEESAAEERAVNTIVLPELDGDREHIVIAANVRSFDEAYEALGDEARSLFNKVKAYALSKPDTEEVPLSSGVCIKRGSKKVVKLAVRRGNPVALFLLESDGLKDLRRSASASVRLKVRETELVLREESDLEAAYTMVDLSIGQIERDIEEAKERRREARRLRRRQLRETAASEAAASEETEDIPEEGAADETPADESDE